MNFIDNSPVDESNLVIFYADDDKDDLDTFTEVIDELNINPKLFTHDCGDKLLDALNNPPLKPSIVFIDLNMPGKNGFEVLKEIRTASNFKNIPVVVVSTSSDEKTITCSKDLGASFYITKPTNYNELKKSINHVLHIDWTTFIPDSKSFVYRNN